MKTELKEQLKALHDMLDQTRVALLHIKDRLPSVEENDYCTASRLGQVLFDAMPEVAKQIADFDMDKIHPTLHPEYKEAWGFLVESICSASEDYRQEHGEDRI